ncbi:MAG TPA: hypothetical protein VNS58_17520 [Puia sp.]|jgi:hypothetical protein|nr:hypothetical protein [Puia sp.]
MKRLLFLALSMCFLSVAMGQLKAKVKCPDFYVDILNGTVNELKANVGPGEIKAKFPCFTSVEEEGTSSKCGGGIYFKDKDIYFYTKRDYIEIGPKFIGKLSIPLLGSKRGSQFRTLGNPKMKDDLWDAFEMQYGTLILHYDVAGVAGKVKMIQFSTENTESIQLCE